MKPPTVNSVLNTALAATTASAAIATNVAGSSQRELSVVCSQPFDILFSDDGTSTISNPASTGCFAAGIVHTFQLGPKNTHFKAIAGTAGTLKTWLSSRA